MAGDSLMSDEEHEKRYGKSFVPVSKTHCNDDYKSPKAGPGWQWIDIKVWEICLLDTGQAVFVYDPNSTQTNNTTPNPWIGYFGFNGCPLNTAAGVTSWPPGAGGNSNYNMTQKVLAAQAWYDWVVQEIGPVNIGDQVEVDMTGKPPFGSPGNWPDGVWPTGMCAIGGVQDVNKICFIYRGEYPPTPCEDFLTLSQQFQDDCCEKCNSGSVLSPSDPCFNYCKCCDPVLTPSGWDCEITAYQSTPPYAPIYSCVQKYFPQVGAFLTQQDCINSHCGSLPLATVQCSRCNNGSAVSNVFQGTTCPPGWQPASLGDPCKPPTGPTPIDPVLSTPRVPGSTGRTDSSSY